MSKNFTKLSPDELTIDHSYQRELDEGRVNAMSKDFDLARVGVPVVSLRKDDTYVVLDGQHRVEAMRRAGYRTTKILCEVHNGLSARDEAELYLKLNGGRKAIGVHDKWKARIRSQDPGAIEIAKIVESLGLRIGRVPGKHTICAVQSIESAHKRNGNLKTTLHVLKEWGRGDLSALEGEIIKDMSTFLRDHEEVDSQELITKLAKRDPGHVLRQIKATADALNKNRRLAANSVFREIYNHRRAKGRLDPVE